MNPAFLIKGILLLSVLLFASWLALRARSLPPDPRLFGTWKSNRELTAKTIHIAVPADRLVEFLAVFGKMRVTYTADTVTAFMPATGKFPDWKHATSYRVTASKADSVTIQSHDWPVGSNRPTVAHFVSPDQFWMELSAPEFPTLDMTGWREFFDRVPATISP